MYDGIEIYATCLDLPRFLGEKQIKPQQTERF